MRKSWHAKKKQVSGRGLSAGKEPVKEKDSYPFGESGKDGKLLNVENARLSVRSISI